MKFQGPDCRICLSRKFSIFNFCSPEELENINDQKNCSIYKKGQVIFQEGSRPFGLYCINSGKVKISKKTSEGKEQIIRLARPGDPIGYRAILADSLYTASAVALENTTVCFIPRERFCKMIGENKKAGEDILRRVCIALGEAEEKITRIALQPGRQRLAEALLLLNDVYNTRNDKLFSISISREDLASMIGTAKETATRFLSEFKDEKIIDTRGSKIIILDPDRLTRTGGILG